MNRSLIKKIALLAFLVVTMSAALISSCTGAEYDGYLAGGFESTLNIPLGNLQEGGSGEIEFRVVDPGPGKDPEHSKYTFIFFPVIMKNRVPAIYVWNHKAVWRYKYSPDGRRFGGIVKPVGMIIDMKGNNRLKFNRKGNAIHFKINGFNVGSLPARKPITKIAMQVCRMVVEYRWVSRNFKLPCRENEIRLERNIASGHYFITPWFFTLKSGDSVKIYFDLLRANYHPKWANSISFSVNKKVLMITKKRNNEHYYKHSGSDEKKEISLKTGENCMEIKRKGNRIQYILNGKSLWETNQDITGDVYDWAIRSAITAFDFKLRAVKN